MQKNMKTYLLIVILIVLLGCTIDVTQIDPQELYKQALQNKEVKQHLGNREIEYYEVSAAVAFAERGIGPSAPELYEILAKIEPSCLEKIYLGEVIRDVRIITANLNIDAVYSAETNKIECVFSYNPDFVA